METIASNERLAKNTLLLYARTILVMIITLYTSRVVLKALGVDDYGIYNVVGGVVAMFGMISGSFSGSIMRFITIELGRGNNEKLSRVFSTGINILMAIALVVFILAETIGLWFLNCKMNIPLNRMDVANWVWHFSVLTFIINLISLPYNAVIIAHERMSAFAFISIIDVTLKLLSVYLLCLTSIDNLLFYAFLQLLIAFVIRIIYGIYCTHHFLEAKYKYVRDGKLVKEMASFAGWTSLTGTAYLLNTQGINILINIFFNVGINAARGLATQVQSALTQFIENFTTAIYPQITKLYASGNIKEMESLVIRGAKFSFMLSLLICLPVLIETEYILKLWLTTVPSHTVAFVRLAIIGTMIDRLGNTGYTACMATGIIKKYVLWITSIGCLVFPLTWLSYSLGAPAEMAYVIFAFVYVGVDSVRLWIMKGLLNFPVLQFVSQVIFRVLIVSVFATVFPLLIKFFLPQSFFRFVINVITSFISASCSIYFLGLTPNERKGINGNICSFVYSKIRK